MFLIINLIVVYYHLKMNYYYPIIPSNLFDLAKQDFANFIVETFPLYDIKCMTNAVSNEIIKIEQKITNIEMEVVQQYIC